MDPGHVGTGAGRLPDLRNTGFCLQDFFFLVSKLYFSDGSEGSGTGSSGQEEQFPGRTGRGADRITVALDTAT